MTSPQRGGKRRQHADDAGASAVYGGRDATTIEPALAAPVLDRKSKAAPTWA